jgi:hypothetical protein
MPLHHEFAIKGLIHINLFMGLICLSWSIEAIWRKTMNKVSQDPRDVKVADFPTSASLRDKFSYLLNYAVLAPSGHNTQPWLFQILDDSVKVIFDKSRVLGFVDPDHRELVISCGAALCNFELAARHFGLQTKISFTPDGGPPDLLASITVKEGKPPTDTEQALFAAITSRQTNRSPFTQDEVTPLMLADCIAAAASYDIQFNHCDDDHTKSVVAEIVMQGDRWQFAQPWFRSELATWMHSSKKGSRDGMSGSRFGIPDLFTPVLGFIMRTFNIGKQVGRANSEKIRSASPVIALFSSRNDNIEDWLNTGRALEHCLLSLCAAGYTASYLNQAVETKPLRKRLRLVFESLPYPQLMIRIGKAPPGIYSVRRSVEECLLKPIKANT